jgi:hypothetical protein
MPPAIESPALNVPSILSRVQLQPESSLKQPLPHPSSAYDASRALHVRLFIDTSAHEILMGVTNNMMSDINSDTQENEFLIL